MGGETEMAAMRDVFFDIVYERAKRDRGILILSADFSAPSLDKFRLELPSQYIFMGICEQNMMLVAAGLALEGKRPICYAISPFATLRCLEQTKLYASGMNLPITIVGVGAGVAYNDSGYTHHSLEDIAVMRPLPNMRVFQPCDNEDVRQMADIALASNGPIYMRLDRYGEDVLYDAEHTVSGTYSIAKPIKKVNILAAGSMMRVAGRVYDCLYSKGIEIGVINANIIPLDAERLSREINGTDLLFTLEEHALSGGLGSHVLEAMMDNNVPVKVKRLGFDISKGYVDMFGSRDDIYEAYGVDVGSVERYIANSIGEWQR